MGQHLPAGTHEAFGGAEHMNYQPGVEASVAEAASAPRHSANVRVSHWLGVASILGLFLTGFGILISHPRLYWGETGAVGAPSLVDLPLPFIIGPSVWNRPIHFLFAWMLVLTGFVYIVAGIVSGHFRRNLMPAKAELTWKRVAGTIKDHLSWRRTEADEAWTYNVVQRLTYLAVIFVVFPAILWTGLAMSPALMTVFPRMVTVLGGHQSARTLHFVFASALLLFLIVHIAMLFLVGFTSHVRAMITGYRPGERSAR
jgi:thiosulfate reductase cytochrome b subunit